MAWLSGYSKRKELVLTGGASGAQTDFQLKLAVAYAAAMQGDFDDIRFTQSNGTTEIDAWLETKTNDTSATVWVEFPSTPANTVEQTYYMYYGNGSAVSDWDGDATFPHFFEDFENGVGDWTSQTDSSIVAQSTTVKSGTYSGHHTATTDNRESHKSCTAQTSDFLIDVDLRPDAAAGDPSHLIFRVAKTAEAGVHTDCIRLEADDDLRWSLYPGNGNFMPMSDQWYKFKLLVHPSTDTVDIWVDDVSKVTAGAVNGDISTINSIGFMMYYSSGEGLYSDNIRIRKYASGPPTYAFGSEESSISIPVIIYHLRQQGIL